MIDIFDKTNRNYRFLAETVLGTTLEIAPPFTLELDITRNILTSANVCQIRLYNLSPFNRNQLYFNSSDITGTQSFRQIQLKAGYGDKNLPTIFQGNMREAWSVREGVNFITQIECLDGGYSFVNDHVNETFPIGTPLVIVIRTLMSKLTGISIGAVGNFPGVLLRENTYSGNPYTILFELTGGGFFIDNQKAYAMGINEFVPEISAQSLPISLITDKTGLLNTPVIERTLARFEMLFEPTLNPGRLVTVASLTFPEFNGVYSIKSVKHRGIISRAVSGTLTTTCEFYRNKLQIPVVPF